MIKSIHHISFTVSNAEKSIQFYRNGLGFEVISDRDAKGKEVGKVIGLKQAHLRIIHLHGHGLGLELIQYLNPKGMQKAVRVCDVGSSHICFVVDDIDDVLCHLKDQGAKFISEPMVVNGGPNAGNRYVYFLDPDGIPMELSQPAVKTKG